MNSRSHSGSFLFLVCYHAGYSRIRITSKLPTILNRGRLSERGSARFSCHSAGPSLVCIRPPGLSKTQGQSAIISDRSWSGVRVFRNRANSLDGCTCRIRSYRIRIAGSRAPSSVDATRLFFARLSLMSRRVAIIVIAFISGMVIESRVNQHVLFPRITSWVIFPWSVHILSLFSFNSFLPSSILISSNNMVVAIKRSTISIMCGSGR